MRRTRDKGPGSPGSTQSSSPWKYALLAIPAVGVALGAQYAIRNWYPKVANSELAMALKPSWYHPDSGAGSGADSSLIAKQIAEGGIAELGDDPTDLAEYGDEYDDEGQSRKRGSMARLNRDGKFDQEGEDGALSSGMDGTKCTSIEYRGDGPVKTRITEEEWAQVTTQFNDVKSELQAWLEKNRMQFPDRTAKVMEKQLKTLTLQRPPQADEPDLNWRGIGVWSRTKQGDPMLRLGGGFVKLSMKQPVRAKFELARLVAQSWAPCELQRVNAAGAWDPLLKCLNMTEEGCAAGSYSEGGWAVSSVLANTVAAPGCTLPAFTDAKLAACAQKIPLPLSADRDAPAATFAQVTSTGVAQ